MIYAKVKNILFSLYYKLMCCFFSQKNIILYTSSRNDLFSNISSIAHEFDIKNIKYIMLTCDEKTDNKLLFFRKLATAKVLVIDADSPAAKIELHRSTYLIQCWHAGGAYKKIGFDAKRKGISSEVEERRLTRIHRCISYFVCTSYETAEIYSRAFHLDRKKMLIFGMPRLDSIIQKMPLAAPEDFTILYAPTFRTKNNIRQMPTPPDILKFRSQLESVFNSSIRFAFRGHPTAPGLMDFQGWEDWSALSQAEALQRTSILITDYSSIFFDYLPFRRHIIFYVPDIERYQNEEQGLYFSPYDLFPKTTCATEKELIDIVMNCNSLDIDYESVWRKYMKACDGHATKRLCSFIEHLMERS